MNIMYLNENSLFEISNILSMINSIEESVKSDIIKLENIPTPYRNLAQYCDKVLDSRVLKFGDEICLKLIKMNKNCFDFVPLSKNDIGDFIMLELPTKKIFLLNHENNKLKEIKTGEELSGLSGAFPQIDISLKLKTKKGFDKETINQIEKYLSKKYNLDLKIDKPTCFKNSCSSIVYMKNLLDNFTKLFNPSNYRKINQLNKEFIDEKIIKN